MSWSHDNCASAAALRAATERSSAARRLEDAAEAKVLMEAEWRVGMRGGHDANVIYAYTGANEFADLGVCEVYRVPRWTAVEDAKREPGYAVAEHICKLHNESLKRRNE